MLKLIRDWLEKFSVGSILVGLYQSSTTHEGAIAFTLSVTAASVALYFAKRGIK
jgi:hypothetical protein